MALQKIKPPAGGWYKGPPESEPGKYNVHVGLATSAYVPGFTAEGSGGVNSWSGGAHFVGDKTKVDYPAFDIAWSCRYKTVPGAEARCRTATEKAVARLQAYYDKTGLRWECVRKAARRNGEALPWLPPAD